MSDVREQPKAIDIRGLFWAESVGTEGATA
jgi:hypothetical protein